MIDKVVSLLRLKGEYLTPEIKFFIVTLCHYSASKEKGVIIDTEKSLANNLGVSLSTLKQGIRYLEDQDFLLCDKEVDFIKLKFTDTFFTYITKVSGTVERVVGQRIQNLLGSELFKSLSKRVAVKLFLLTLLSHSDENGIVRNLSIKDLQELMGRFSKDRHRSQLELLKKSGYILGYSPGMSGGPILGKQKSEYLINVSHKTLYSNFSKKYSSQLFLKNKNDDDFIAIRLSGLIDDIQKVDVHPAGTTKKINKLLHDLSLDGINEIEKVGNVFSGEVRGFQIQRYIFTLALYHLNKHDWELPDVAQVRNMLDFEVLFSEKFLRETLRALIDKEEKISQKPLKEQVNNYKTLEQYMSQSMISETKPIAATKNNAHQIASITTLIAHSVVFTSKFITRLLGEKDKQPNPTAIAVFISDEDILLHFH